ncbi:MAG: hypothetical protein NVSMB53_16140 [Gemmatimonadaceae bacterium]
MAELNGVLSVRTDAATRDRMSRRDTVCSYLAVDHSRGTSVAYLSGILIPILRETEDGWLGAAELPAHQLVGMKFHPIGSAGIDLKS